MIDLNIDKCWIWHGYKTRLGYGYIGINGKLYFVHRIAYRLFVGHVAQGQKICHRCDVPACWNPHHLFKGTQRDNVEDMMKKGRGARHDGEHNGSHKLNYEIVNEIRSLYEKGGRTQRNLAKQFNVSQSVIWAVLDRKSWTR